MEIDKMKANFEKHFDNEDVAGCEAVIEDLRNYEEKNLAETLEDRLFGSIFYQGEYERDLEETMAYDNYNER